MLLFSRSLGEPFIALIWVFNFFQKFFNGHPVEPVFLAIQLSFEFAYFVSGAAARMRLPRAKQATGNGAADDDHRHLLHDPQQFVDDAVDVEVDEALA